jgi:hypothetical protein
MKCNNVYSRVTNDSGRRSQKNEGLFGGKQSHIWPHRYSSTVSKFDLSLDIVQKRSCLTAAGRMPNDIPIGWILIRIGPSRRRSPTKSTPSF